jgi:hypothetical protein
MENYPKMFEINTLFIDEKHYFAFVAAVTGVYTAFTDVLSTMYATLLLTCVKGKCEHVRKVNAFQMLALSVQKYRLAINQS